MIPIHEKIASGSSEYAGLMGAVLRAVHLRQKTTVTATDEVFYIAQLCLCSIGECAGIPESSMTASSCSMNVISGDFSA